MTRISHEKDTIVASFTSHAEAEAAVKALATAGVEMGSLSVIGKGYHTDEHVVGFYNIGDRMMFWGKNGAFWGAIWGWLMTGLMITVPGFGPVMVLGYLAAVVLSAVEGAVVVGGLSALGAALYSIGVPKDSILNYESTLEADGFLVMAHGSAEEVARAKAVLQPLQAGEMPHHAAANLPA
jgi:hypothetical protein